MKRKILISGVALAIVAALLLVALKGIMKLPETEFSGMTMGTTYSIKIVDAPAELDETKLNEEIKERLETIDNNLSTYNTESEISRFNQHNSQIPLSASTDFYSVLRQAETLHAETKGNFDVTVGNIVNIWGFGPGERPQTTPDDETIEEALYHVGMEKLGIGKRTTFIKKLDPSVQVDLSAIAKGYAVDVIAELFRYRKVENYLIEIGGEIRAKGFNSKQKDWLIAIEKPNSETREPLVSIKANAAAIATSGNYRNFYEIDGKRYSHTIDPKTGKPVTHNLASVTVIAEKCATADAWATALMVLGPEAGMDIALDKNLAALFVTETNGSFEKTYSDAFLPYLN